MCFPNGGQGASQMVGRVLPKWWAGCFPNGGQGASEMVGRVLPKWWAGCFPNGGQVISSSSSENATCQWLKTEHSHAQARSWDELCA